LINRVAEKIFIPEERREMYASAVLEEYSRVVLRWEKSEKAKAGEQEKVKGRIKLMVKWPFNFFRRKEKK